MSFSLFSLFSYLNEYNNILNGLHVESRYYSNVIPNSGVNVLSGLDIFTGSDNIKNYINARFRDLFFRGYDRQREFEEFINGISADLDIFLENYTECYRQLPVDFAIEAEEDLISIMRCFSD